MPPAVRLALTSLVLISAIALAACGGRERQPDGPGAVAVVATTTQVADLARNVGGDRLQLTQILQPGSDPHGFEPRPSDVVATAEADLVFKSGGDLDPWAERLLADSGGEAELVELGSADDELDPHWWHNPQEAIAAVERIAQLLGELDPEGAERYRANARAYSRRIERLDRQIEACVVRLPESRRKLVTDHGAFGHFARRYGFEIVGALIPARTTEAQPSARDLRELAATVRREGVPAIFAEASLSPRLAETLAAETGATAARTLYGDSLGPADSDGATYLAMMAANAHAIVDGLSEGEIRCELDPGE